MAELGFHSSKKFLEILTPSDKREEKALGNAVLDASQCSSGGYSA